MTDQSIVAYCVKCREKRDMQTPQAVYTAAGTPGTRGVCPVCGTTMFRMGMTPAHEGLPRPVVKSKSGKARNRSARTSRKKGRLVIVESPAKARTVGKFLGRDYVVKASVGHVRDLLRSQLSVDIENDFAPKYRVPKEKRPIVNELKSIVKNAAEVYLATDPDREGEAIAWHLIEATGIDEDQVRRVVFHEITQNAITEAFAHPRGLDMNRVNAQQARRILDRLVGYMISPLLWENVRSRTSAGRVQSVALRLVVEREREIQAFVPEEYWSIEAELAKRVPERPLFVAKLIKIGGEKVDLRNEEDTHLIVEELERAAYVVADVRTGERKRSPAPPFITSTLQQEASRRLGFTARRTMRVAQQLYEGIELGKQGTQGLITYMRTDSTYVAEVAQAEARDFIAQRYGKDYLPAKPPRYKTRAKGAQEAHEAIRPTSVIREPGAVKPFLSKEQFQLYALIWQRFVASQMAPAIYDTVSVDVVTDSDGLFGDDRFLSAEQLSNVSQRSRYLFRASGSRVRFPGFLAVYEESRDEDAAPDEDGVDILPDLVAGEVVDLVKLIPEQHFTQPPPRYTEATLVRALEEYGIGRPSTYAPIISTIQDRGYVERIERRLHPTELGFIVNDLLVKHFPGIVDVSFTALMEEDLDLIARGEREWVPVLREFYEPFERAVKLAEQTMEKVSVADQVTGEKCEKCGHDMIIKWGRYGKFIACSNFPTCRNTRPYLEKIGVACPECGGDLVEKRSRKNRVFYGCSNYPECNFVSWKRPLSQPCPICGGLLVVKNKQWAQCINCEEQVAMEKLSEEGKSAPQEAEPLKRSGSPHEGKSVKEASSVLEEVEVVSE
ncbi:MAG: type I DNA topoisomerase [Anaerolineae bacterium]